MGGNLFAVAYMSLLSLLFSWRARFRFSVLSPSFGSVLSGFILDFILLTCFTDMRDQFVYDPLISKRQQLLLATQVVRMILKVDDVITQLPDELA
jgi:hypothetical protein